MYGAYRFLIPKDRVQPPSQLKYSAGRTGSLDVAKYRHYLSILKQVGRIVQLV